MSHLKDHREAILLSLPFLHLLASRRCITVDDENAFKQAMGARQYSNLAQLSSMNFITNTVLNARRLGYTVRDLAHDHLLGGEVTCVRAVAACCYVLSQWLFCEFACVL